MGKKQNASREAGKRRMFRTRSFGTMQVTTNAYQRGGQLAVELVDCDGEAFTTLSVNIPERTHLLGDHEFFAKTWGENEEIAEDALASGIFQDTGRTDGGVLNARIWTLT